MAYLSQIHNRSSLNIQISVIEDAIIKGLESANPRWKILQCRVKLNKSNTNVKVEIIILKDFEMTLRENVTKINTTINQHVNLLLNNNASNIALEIRSKDDF